MNTEQEVLKRCPFCGSEATLERVPETMIADCTDAVVRCSNCGALGPPILYERDTGQDDPHPEAIAAWNRRAPAVAAGGVTEERVRVAADTLQVALNRQGWITSGGLAERTARAILTAALAVGDEGIREGAE